jgi:hypothetical protein
MATYQYNWVGIDTTELQGALRPTLSVTIKPTAPPVTIDVTLKDETLADKNDLDTAMLTQGWEFGSLVP